MKKQKATPAKSLKEFADEKREKIIQHGQPLNGWNVSLNLLCTPLGPMAYQQPKNLPPANFVPVRQQLSDSGFAPNTISEHARRMRQFLSELVPHGLDPACVAELSGFRFGSKAPLHSEPAQRSHLKVIIDALQSQLELLQLLIWILLSGAPGLRDIVLFEFAGIDWNTGLVRRPCRKPGVTPVFAAQRPLMDLLKERHKRLGPDAVYVFPELLFTSVELRDPNCNKTRLNGSTLRPAHRGAERATKLITDFIVSCGLPLTSVNYKSFRVHMISFWASIGTRRATMARVTGCMSEVEGPFHVPLGSELERLRDVTWKYLEAIRHDEPFVVPTSQYDAYEGLMGELRKIQTEIAKLKPA